MVSHLVRVRAGPQIVLFFDETLFTLAGELGESWSPRGETQEMPSLGKRPRIVVCGAVDSMMGRTPVRVEDRSINQESTRDFLKQLVPYDTKQHPGMPLVPVPDKAPEPTASLVEEYGNELEQVSLRPNRQI